jgi:predicted transcriptional regulator
VPIGTALFAATTAFQLVKEGCALYKEVKGVAGQVKEIYDEINSQFAGQKVSKEQAKVIAKEKERIQEVAKADPTEVVFKIGDNLGLMFDAFDTLEAIFWQQERDAKKVQSKDVSLKRMALKRILIRNKLQSMHAEIKHQMIYESPPELGSLWSDFEAMRDKIEAEQKTAREIQEHEDELELKRKDALMREARDMSIDAGVAFAALLFLGWIMWQIKVQTAARASFWVT